MAHRNGVHLIDNQYSNRALKTAVIGGGAAGCFCAVQLKRNRPEAEVCVFESGPSTMHKLSLTGGGRCNFTNSFERVSSLEEVYPRGFRQMKRLLAAFDHRDTGKWFSLLGIGSVVEPDSRVFPSCMDARKVVRSIQKEMSRLGVSVECGHRVESISPAPQGGWTVDSEHFDNVVVTTGGGLLKALGSLEIATVKPVPSLFTLKLDCAATKELMGVSAPDATVSIQGTAFKSRGALLITDWGISGPATLRLSSYAARFLAEKNYICNLAINWVSFNQQEIQDRCRKLKSSCPRKMLSTTCPQGFPDRLWKFILKERCGLRDDLRWAEIGDKGINRLSSILTSDSYPVCGRAAFKEEFVTAGGISLDAVDIRSLECKKYPGLYFAGEVLDIDAVTGGFNLQAAWSTAFCVAAAISD